MATVPNRQELEDQMAAIVLLLFGEDYRGILNGERFNARDTAERLAPQLVEPLVGGYLAAARRVPAPRGSRPDLMAPLEARATRWANRYSQTLSRELANATRDRIRGLDPDAEGFDEQLADTLGSDRAAVIGITETTRTYSAGQFGAADEIEKQTGVKLACRWWTQRDARVCPICEPLDGTTRRVWGRRFPNGPPAHPVCRCGMRWS